MKTLNAIPPPFLAADGLIELEIQPDKSKHHRSGNAQHTGSGTGRIAEGEDGPARHNAATWGYKDVLSSRSRERVTKATGVSTRQGQIGSFFLVGGGETVPREESSFRLEVSRRRYLPCRPCEDRTNCAVACF